MLLFPILSFCNDIRGNIKDENKVPLEFVNVMAMSDKDSIFCVERHQIVLAIFF